MAGSLTSGFSALALAVLLNPAGRTTLASWQANPIRANNDIYRLLRANFSATYYSINTAFI
ncbi:MAG: hypothetical protein AAF688_08035 [Bacteroidota bacterium]